MTKPTEIVNAPANQPEHIAFALWPLRNRFRRLHEAEFASELDLLYAVRTDLAKSFYSTLDSAIAFYKDLNQAVAQQG